MKQPKKRWAWTARQHGRIRLYKSFHYNFYHPGRTFTHQLWEQHRSQTRQALCQLRKGLDETEVHFPYHHKHSGHWLCT